MSRTYKDRPARVRVATHPREMRQRPHRAVISYAYHPPFRHDTHHRYCPMYDHRYCEYGAVWEARVQFPKWWTNVSKEQRHNAWSVPDRRHTRDILHRLQRESRWSDELDDSLMQPTAQRGVWGGGFLD